MRSAQLHNGSCLPLLMSMPDESVDAIITDPPYCSGGASIRTRAQDPVKKYEQTGTIRKHPTFGGDMRDQRSYFAWVTLWLEESYRITRNGGHCLIFADWRQLPVMTDAVQAAGWQWRGIIPWDKTEGARPTKGGFRNQAEYIVWGAKGAIHATPESPCLPGVFRQVVLQSDKHHLTGKPTALMQNLVRIVRPGGTVVDPFMGSGTTGVAAVQANLNFIGVEQSAEIFQTAQSRIETALAAMTSP